MSNIIFNKKTIVCPICGKTAREIPIFNGFIFSCDSCDFRSIDPKCVDISYKDDLSAPLSNLYPNAFMMPYTHRLKGIITIPSMESFLQGLKIKDPQLQYLFMSTYSGMDAKKMSGVLDDWKKDQLLYFDGRAYQRYSEEYTDLISRAYDSLFNTNQMFREIILPRFKECYIIHSIGSDNEAETVLTESEFRYQINRLLARLDE